MRRHIEAGHFMDRIRESKYYGRRGFTIFHDIEVEIPI
jgi:hypothetical protein